MDKQKRNKRLKVYLKSTLIGVGITVVCIASFLVYFFKGIRVDSDFDRQDLPPTIATGQATEKEEPEKKEVNQNIAILGVDKDEARTDTILILHFNSEQKELKVVSIPRDTKVTWSAFQIEKAIELERPYQYTSKITDMSSLGGINNLRYFTLHTLESTLGITIDHYAVVNLEIVKLLVDELGGIEVDVPRRMEYTDEAQGLFIDLYEGTQVLDGNKAEGLLRWRHNNSYSSQYAEGDLGRIETQQLFMKAFLDKILSPSMYKNLFSVLKIVYENIKTDVTLTEALQYLKYAEGFSAGNVSFETVPGENVREDLWYYKLDEERLEEWVQDVFYAQEVETTE